MPANSSVAVTFLPDEINAATERLRSMKDGRHREVFATASRLADLGLSWAEIETELNAVVGSEPHMRQRVAGATKSLKKYGLL
jgi:hypothetical protein